LTLVELMMSLVLSLLIMGGAISIFMSSKETFRLEEDLSRVQENFRYISDRLVKDLSLVGYSGCVLPYKDNSSTVSNLVSGGLGVRDVVRGTEGGNATTPDSLTLSYGKTETGAMIVGGGTDRTDDINISKDTYLYKALDANFKATAKNRVAVTLLVGNCDGADIFVPTALTDVKDENGVATGEAAIAHKMNEAVGGVSNTDDNFSFAYGDPDLSLSKVYYVEDVTYEICTDAAGDTGLCVTRGGGSREMLMPDVTGLQVKYGIDSTGGDDGNTDRYVDWSNSIENADITGIRVTLTMVLNQVSGNNVNKEYTFTVKLRNMGLDI
jgi:type IV pilus assembly protein PilW